jgi:hypothetical protein
MPYADVTLPGTTSSVPTARRFVESVLSGWGHPDLGWSAAVCVSELAANCALHARTDFTVTVDLEGEVARVGVTDRSRRAPAVRDYGSDATTGRGLRLVGEYARDWGVDLTDEGKTVWVVLAPEPPAALDLEDDEDLSVDALLARFDGDGPDEPAATAECAWLVAA